MAITTWVIKRNHVAKNRVSFARFNGNEVIWSTFPNAREFYTAEEAGLFLKKIKPQSGYIITIEDKATANIVRKPSNADYDYCG